MLCYIEIIDNGFLLFPVTHLMATLNAKKVNLLLEDNG